MLREVQIVKKNIKWIQFGTVYYWIIWPIIFATNALINTNFLVRLSTTLIIIRAHLCIRGKNFQL